FDVIMIGSFSIAISLALLTYHYIISVTSMILAKADTGISLQTLNLQFKLLVAVCAQTFVPLVFVYLPYLGVNHFAALGLPSFSIDSFPAWDAMIILFLIRDYREGVLSMVKKKKTTTNETTWRSVSTVQPLSSDTQN
ncbi:hypothetical protein PMAYCL1PPCAC_15895, partial [Pristionchus mayeri]